MTEFDDERLIRTLRSAGTDGPAFAMTPLHETTRRGRAARRLRTVLTGAGTTVLAAGLVTAALAMPSLLKEQDVVPAPAVDTTEEPNDEPTAEPADATMPVTADEMIAAHKAAVFEALPDGFVRLTEENREDAKGMAGFALAESAPATDGLPDGMSAGVDLMFFPGSNPIDITGHWCDGLAEKGSTRTDCVDRVVNGETVQVQEWSQLGSSERRAYETTRTTYVQPTGDAIVLDVQAWEDEVTADPRSEAARAWVDAMHERIVSVLIQPSLRLSDGRERSLAQAEDLASDLGEGWYVFDEPPAPAVYPSDALEASLPDGTSVGVTREVLRDADLSELCAARTEDGIRREACEPVSGGGATVSYGAMVDPEHRGDDSFDSRIADVIVYHRHEDGSIVKVRVVVAGMGAVGTDSAPDPSSLRPWLEDLVPSLARAATSADW